MKPNLHRVALAAAAFVAVVTVAGAFVLDGYRSAAPARLQPAAAAATDAATDPATAGPQVIYVRPAPTQQVIQVTQTDPPLGPPPVIHQIVPGGGDDEHDGDHD